MRSDEGAAAMGRGRAAMTGLGAVAATERCDGATPAIAEGSAIGTYGQGSDLKHACKLQEGTRDRQRTGSWTDETLYVAMDKITDEGMKLKVAAKIFGIPSSSLRDHLYGRTTSRQRGTKPTLKAGEEKRLVDYLFKMQDLGHPLTPLELRLKVATATQTREMPWSASGVLGTDWLRRFCSKHPEIASRRSQGLEVARARSLYPATAETLYGNLETLYRTHNYHSRSHIEL